MNRVVIRTDANARMGLGHLMRCLALAQQLVADEVEVIFAVNEQTLPYCRSRHDWVGKILLVPALDTDAEPAWLAAQTEVMQAQALTLDGYQFNQAYRKALKEAGCRLVLFDDNNDSGQLHADMIINGAANAAALGYEQSAPDAIHCTGEAYRVLRREFLLCNPDNWPVRQSLLISMGGSDPRHLTLPILHALEQASATMPIRVVTGAAYADLDALSDFIHKSPLAIQHLHDCQQIADVFCHSRLVISAAGGSQFELHSCATPSVLLVVADNQLNATQTAAKQGWCESLDARKALDTVALTKSLLTLWQNEQRLLQMHQCALKQADPLGVRRVADKLYQLGRTEK